MHLLTSFLLCLACNMVSVLSGFQDVGYPGGFFQYGDKNNDGQIDQGDIEKNLNMAWLMEYHDLMKKAPDQIQRAGFITEQEYLNLLAATKGNKDILLLLMLLRN